MLYCSLIFDKKIYIKEFFKGKNIENQNISVLKVKICYKNEVFVIFNEKLSYITKR